MSPKVAAATGVPLIKKSKEQSAIVKYYLFAYNVLQVLG